MEFIFDIFLFLVLILVILISTKRGFVRSVWASVTIIGAFALAYTFGPALGDYFCSEFILPKVTEYVYELINGMTGVAEGGLDFSEFFATLPDEFIIMSESFGVSLDALREEFLSVMVVSQDEVYELASSIALPISSTISHLIGIIVAFFASVIVLTIIGFIVKIISKIPVIKTLDGILGFIFGIIKGIVIISMICVVAAVFVESEFMNGSIGAYFRTLTECSYIFRFFCAFSPVDFINIG